MKSTILLTAGLIATLACADPFRLDSLIAAKMAQFHIAGLAAAVVKSDAVVWHKAYGYARLEDSVRTADTTVFDLASVSKPVTATALMQLWERGRFELDDDISTVLPFVVRNPNYPNCPITFRMMLTHSSSIIDNWDVLGSLRRQGDPDVSLRDLVTGYLVPGGIYYDSTRNFGSWEPGEQFEYSNIGFALVGYLIEAMAGDYRLYSRDSVFRPLGMNRTVWFFADIDTNGMAMPYRYSAGRYIRYGHQSLPDYPTGTLKSSTLQLARFLQAHLNWGRTGATRILDSTTAALMSQVHFPPNAGLGWYSEQFGSHPAWGHNGLWNGISTCMAFSREENSAAVVLCNSAMGGGPIMGEIMPALFDYALQVGLTEERTTLDRNPTPTSTVVRDVLRVPGTPCTARNARLTLLDTSGRTVMRLNPGSNDISHLAPGVFFVCEYELDRTGTCRTRKVIIRK